MKTLILIFLIFFLISCTDNSQKVTQSTTPTLVETATNTEPIIEELLIASYNDSEHLVLIESDYNTWYSAIIQASDGQITFQEAYDPYMIGYEATYWDSEHGTLYHASIKPTNGIQYTLDTNKQYEQVFHRSLREYYPLSSIPNITNQELTNLVNTCLLYVGNITNSNNSEIIERIYVNKSDQEQYIKQLYPKEMIYREKFDSTNRLYISSPIYPAFINENSQPVLIYTNQTHQAFRYYYEEGLTLTDFPSDKDLFSF